MTDINVGAISEALNNKADLDLNNTNPLARTVVEVSDKSLMPSWYRVYSDGWCEQGGTLNGANDANIRVDFIKSYNNLINVITTACNTSAFYTDSANNFWHIDLHSATINRADNNGFYFNAPLRSGSGSAYGKDYWQASGYIN